MSQISFDGQSLFSFGNCIFALATLVPVVFGLIDWVYNNLHRISNKAAPTMYKFSNRSPKTMGDLRAGAFWALKKANPQFPLLSHTPGKSSKCALPAILQLPFNTVGHFDHCKNCSVNCAKSAQPPFFPRENCSPCSLVWLVFAQGSGFSVPRNMCSFPLFFFRAGSFRFCGFFSVLAEVCASHGCLFACVGCSSRKLVLSARSATASTITTTIIASITITLKSRLQLPRTHALHQHPDLMHWVKTTTT